MLLRNAAQLAPCLTGSQKISDARLVFSGWTSPLGSSEDHAPLREGREQRAAGKDIAPERAQEASLEPEFIADPA